MNARHSWLSDFVLTHERMRSRSCLDRFPSTLTRSNRSSSSSSSSTSNNSSTTSTTSKSDPQKSSSDERVGIKTRKKPEWAKDERAIDNIAFALVNPQGAMNCGASARVMQNFGIYDLRVCLGSKDVFMEADLMAQAPQSGADEASEREGEATEIPWSTTETTTGTERRKYSRESYRFACAADWMLERAEREKWFEDVRECTKDCSVVFATTARNRDGSQTMLDSRAAAKLAAKLALDGEKVCFLFGNERVGLTNEELRTAQYLVAIPTCSVGEVCGKSKKYNGGTGPTSLNLSHAVSVIAYDAFVEITMEEARRKILENDTSMINDDLGDDEDDDDATSEALAMQSLKKTINVGKSIENEKLMSSGEKQQLTQVLYSARRSLDVCSNNESNSDSIIDDKEDLDLQSREFKAIERILSNPNLRSRDCAVLFQIARRVLTVMGETDGYDETPLDEVIIRELKEQNKVKSTVREARNALREKFDISLTNKEITKAQRKILLNKLN